MYRGGRLAIHWADRSPVQDGAEEILNSLAVQRQVGLHV